jgi:16S rRNA (guanine527-N7)-methyltransferase
MESFREILAQEFAPYGSLSETQLISLERHYELMLRWNRKLNLTRITDLREAVQLHYCESLYLAEFLPKRPLTIVDIGSGAGFPGIAVAVYRPDSAVDLVEAHQRKAVFLTEAIRHLGLTNARVISERAEDVDGRYDWIISRAVRPEDVLALELAPDIAILGSEGAPLPWGESRALFHVKRPG